jgi:hypothetical protein
MTPLQRRQSVFTAARTQPRHASKTSTTKGTSNGITQRMKRPAGIPLHPAPFHQHREIEERDRDEPDRDLASPPPEQNEAGRGERPVRPVVEEAELLVGAEPETRPGHRPIPGAEDQPQRLRPLEAWEDPRQGVEREDDGAGHRHPREQTRRISAVAVCCSSDSVSARLRLSTSLFGSAPA